MSGPTVHKLKRALEELRDELTAEEKTARVWPLGCDILATNPGLLTRLAAKLGEP